MTSSRRKDMAGFMCRCVSSLKSWSQLCEICASEAQFGQSFLHARLTGFSENENRYGPRQIMWRYFEQQSFYMEEDEFASHCEAVAQLLNQWNAVDYFCDYIASIKKRRMCSANLLPFRAEVSGPRCAS